MPEKRSLREKALLAALLLCLSPLRSALAVEIEEKEVQALEKEFVDKGLPPDAAHELIEKAIEQVGATVIEKSEKAESEQVFEGATSEAIVSEPDDSIKEGLAPGMEPPADGAALENPAPVERERNPSLEQDHPVLESPPVERNQQHNRTVETPQPPGENES